MGVGLRPLKSQAEEMLVFVHGIPSAKPCVGLQRRRRRLRMEVQVGELAMRQQPRGPRYQAGCMFATPETPRSTHESTPRVYEAMGRGVLHSELPRDVKPGTLQRHAEEMNTTPTNGVAVGVGAWRFHRVRHKASCRMWKHGHEEADQLPPRRRPRP